jgi:hypothetical protein
MDLLCCYCTSSSVTFCAESEVGGSLPRVAVGCALVVLCRGYICMRPLIYYLCSRCFQLTDSWVAAPLANALVFSLLQSSQHTTKQMHQCIE